MSRKIFRVVVGLFCLTWLAKEVLVPGAAALYYSKSYQALVEKCDQAMDSEWYRRQTPQSEIGAKADVIQLLDCHDYDQTRKAMLVSGLPETYLQWLELRSLDIHQRTPADIAEAHRFEYR